jgi:hypothetical protein
VIPGGGALRPTKREGNIEIDVLVEGGRLVTGFPTAIWMRAKPPPGVSPATITFDTEPEPGLEIASTSKAGCDNGWAERNATALSHVVGITITASAPGGASGKWFGVLPVAAGAFLPSVARLVSEGSPVEAVLAAPNPRTVVYAEVDDESGRAFAAALPVKVEPSDATPRARFTIPPMAAGIHWLVVSGEPRGGEKLGGATIARPFLVGTPPGVEASKPCEVGPWLAQRPAPGFPRWIAVDGFPARNASNRTKHRVGLLIALVSLVSAALLEILLMSAAAREARIELQLAELDEDATAEKVTARPPGGGLAIAFLAAVLGFALLAALIVMRS